MPALDIANPGVSAVAAVSALLIDLIEEAATISPTIRFDKLTSNLPPPLNESDFKPIFNRLNTALSLLNSNNPVRDEAAAKTKLAARRDAVVETACRDIFTNLSDSIPIHSPKFVQVWHLFDIIVILSNHKQCNTALVHWLVEELLDRQTIADCRPVFDWLESRRDRITPEEPRKQWSLVLLRSCNELLRRLSRAEDTAFCGRVFIFLFQCFPLGDKSSVNNRGEYHVNNETQWEQDTDHVPASSLDAAIGTAPLSCDDLYPLFWPLQESFSQPLKLMDPSHMQRFKRGMEETVKKFETFPSEEGPRSTGPQDDSKQSLKRKREGSEGDVDTFNPKYLSSKDLFELEISDLTFRRHIFVQALIVMNFILSWTAEAKKKYETINAKNTPVIYTGEFTEEDAKWATDFKQRIAEHMRRDTPGRLFYRMVDTVLARDKNWVYWKMAGCPLITRPPVTPSVYKEAQDSAKRLATNKRLRPHPMGAVNLDFLHTTDEDPLATLKDPKRYQLPELDTFKTSIADNDFEISMPTNDQSKAEAVAGKASKSWRALRVAGRFKLAAFDKIDDQNNISAIYEELKDIDEVEVEDTTVDSDMPTNRDAIIVSGPPGVGKSAVIERLLEAHKGVFAQVVRHTTREPAEGEVNGKAFHFVKPQEFNQLRDGDRLIEYSDAGDISYGTSTKAIEAVTESGKVPIIELDFNAAQFAKDMDFTARYILIKPSSTECLQTRLKDAGKDDAALEAITVKLEEQLDESKTGEVFNTTIINEELDVATKTLGDFLYGKEEPSGENAAEEMDVDDEDTE